MDNFNFYVSAQYNLFNLVFSSQVVHGTAILLTAVMLVVLRCEWRLTVLESSFIASFPFLGQTIGSFVLGKFTDKFGRKMVSRKHRLFLSGEVTNNRLT